jgi:formylglycine-generating enzyme required for sulfatase activity
VKVRTSRGRDEQQWFKPGEGKRESFQDCIDSGCNVKGPEMVVVPKGRFMMGSPPDEPQRQSNEGPQHKVTFRQPFAVGKYAVTFAEWDACVDDGGCGGYKPRDQGWGRGRRPVIFVSWEDAQAYVKWLSTKTGKNYRLLSEAEWEYMARAGTNTQFWWGTTITSEQANYDGQFKYAGSGKGLNRRQTVEVDNFQPNQWGFFQVHGNVWEWTKDCWFDPAKIQPNGEQTQNVGCTNGAPHVIRGGAWNVSPEYLRSASRISGDPVRRFAYLGFRIARELRP